MIDRPRWENFSQRGRHRWDGGEDSQVRDDEWRAVERLARGGDPEALEKRIRLLDAGRAPEHEVDRWKTVEKPARQLRQRIEGIERAIKDTLDYVQGKAIRGRLDDVQKIKEAAIQVYRGTVQLASNLGSPLSLSDLELFDTSVVGQASPGAPRTSVFLSWAGMWDDNKAKIRIEFSRKGEYGEVLVPMDVLRVWSNPDRQVQDPSRPGHFISLRDAEWPPKGAWQA